jgi:predicted SnoaL-like aldol condensation-catalyzing enzyme
MFIQHNTLMCDQPGTAAIFITDQNNAHPSTQVIYTVVIHDNLIGGGVHSLVLDNSTFNTSIDNFHVTDNRFDPFGSSGYARISPAARTNVLWFGNVDGNGNTLAKP